MLFVLAQLSALVHMAVVRHEPCEHGELVETATQLGSTGDDAASANRYATHADDERDEGGDGGEGGESDEHCPLHTCPSIFPSVGPLSLPPLFFAAAHAAAPEQRTEAHADVLRFAPKTSPPMNV